MPDTNRPKALLDSAQLCGAHACHCGFWYTREEGGWEGESEHKNSWLGCRWHSAVVEKLGLTDFRRVHTLASSFRLHHCVFLRTTAWATRRGTATAVRQDSPSRPQRARQDRPARLRSHQTLLLAHARQNRTTTKALSTKLADPSTRFTAPKCRSAGWTSVSSKDCRRPVDSAQSRKSGQVRNWRSPAKFIRGTTLEYETLSSIFLLTATTARHRRATRTKPAPWCCRASSSNYTRSSSRVECPSPNLLRHHHFLRVRVAGFAFTSA